MQNFRKRMADFDLDPGEIIPDSSIHRFRTWGDTSNEMSGAYWHNGKFGWFQDWRSMEKPEVVAGELSKEDKAALNGSFDGRDNRVSREALEAGIRRIWNAGTPPNGHPYLKKKGISPPPEVKQHDGSLVVPVFGVNGELNGLQRIDAGGRKRFLTGTRKKGSFFSINGNGEHVVCEGFSTGCSINEATGYNVVISFDAGNLIHVAREIAKKANPKNIIIAGDNDHANERNIGAKMAEKAANEIGCRFVLPAFQNPDGKKTTDFNDLHIIEGVNTVKTQIDAALAQKPAKNLIQEVQRIISLDPLTREQERNRISEEFNVRKSVIDEFIKGFKKEQESGGTTEIVKEVEPASESISGDKLLSAIKRNLLKYIILPGGIAEPITAWVVLTYCYDAFRILPMLGIVSPVKRCGKTTLLEVLQGMTNKGLTASNISPAAIFRTIEKYKPTLLVDEADTFLKDNDELRGVINSGHTRSAAFVVRVEGEDHEPVKFSTWAPKAISMIGTMADTLEDRSVVVSLRRKAPGESVQRIKRDFELECDEIRRACRRWADDHMDILRESEPDIPRTNNDRMTDNWMPLIMIADAAGGPWPELMRQSMLGMLDGTDDSIGPKLLMDIKGIFDDRCGDRMFSDELVKELAGLKESPWCDWNRGKGLTQNGLARLLKPFEIYSKTLRIGDKQRKGYTSECFKDAFKRYIPPTSPFSSVPSYQSNNINGIDENQTVPSNNDGTDEKQLKVLKSRNCYVGTDENGGEGKETKKVMMEI